MLYLQVIVKHNVRRSLVLFVQCDHPLCHANFSTKIISKRNSGSQKLIDCSILFLSFFLETIFTKGVNLWAQKANNINNVKVLSGDQFSGKYKNITNISDILFYLHHQIQYLLKYCYPTFKFLLLSIITLELRRAKSSIQPINFVECQIMKMPDYNKFTVLFLYFQMKCQKARGPGWRRGLQSWRCDVLGRQKSCCASGPHQQMP